MYELRIYKVFVAMIRIASLYLYLLLITVDVAWLHASEIWSEIEFKGGKIGYSVIKIKSPEKKVEEIAYMKLKAMGLEREVKTYLDWIPGKNWEFETLRFTMESGDSKTSVIASRNKDNLEVQVGEVGRKTFKIGSSEIFTGSSYIFVISEAVKSKSVPESILLNYFDPSVLRLDHLRIILVEKSNDYLKFLKDFAGLKSFIYFDRDGNFLKEESGSGILILASSQKKALHSEFAQVDIIISTSVKADGKAPASSLRTKINEAKIYVKGDVDIPSFPPVQIVERKGEVTLIKLKKGYITDKRNFEDALVSEPLIEADSSEIREIAKKIKQGVRSKDPQDPIATMKAVSDWLYRNLKKTSVLGMPSALEALRTREGDCNEHSILAVAILRALGIPSRVVFGLVYDSGFFFFHAWVEAFDGKKWVEFDPTWGLFPADILRIRLGVGSVSEWVKVLEYVGKIQISFDSWK